MLDQVVGHVQVSKRVKQLLADLTLEEKLSLLSGKDRWHTADVPRLGVNSVRFSDSPAGCRGIHAFNGTPGWVFPCGIALGASWDQQLLEQVGGAIGRDCRAKGCHVLYGPMVNLPRSPLAGRGFECFSEDPLLSGDLAAAYIDGLQAQGVQAALKHIVANDGEDNRYATSANMSEQTLRELYLRAFEIPVKTSRPGVIMASYNQVNGTACCENKHLLHDILKNEWGYQGSTCSDYFAVSSVAESIKAGLDLEMPGPGPMRGEALLRALMAGRVNMRDIDLLVASILMMVERAETSKIPFNKDMELAADTDIPELVRESAERCMVLLKNDKNTLPWSLTDASISSIAIIGPNSLSTLCTGGGSAMIEPPYTTTLAQAVRNHAAGAQVKVTVTPGCFTGIQLPALGPYLRLSEPKELQAQQGFTITFYNEDPWTVGTETANPAFSTTSHSSRCILIDNVPANVIPRPWVEITAKLVVDESGIWELGLILAGQGRLYIDGQCIIDNETNQTLGEAFACAGSIEEKGCVALEKGREHNFEIRFHYGRQVGNSPIQMGYGAIEMTGRCKRTSKEMLELALQAAKDADAVILAVGFPPEHEAEGYDRKSFGFGEDVDTLIEQVLAVNSNCVVVNQTAMPVSMPWVEKAPAILQTWYTGNEFGAAIANLLFGKATPCGKLPMTFPLRIEDTPTYLHEGDQNGVTHYNEGIFMGYRYYDTRNMPVLFPFGHGLSYTNFEYGKVTLKILKRGLEVNWQLTNTGRSAGREVSQVYYSGPSATPTSTVVRRPAQELAGSAVTRISPGETSNVSCTIPFRHMSHWSTADGSWIMPAGKYTIRVSASSRDHRLQAVFDLETQMQFDVHSDFSVV